MKALATGVAVSVVLDLVVAYVFLLTHDGPDFPY
jgi:hypothetical protein